MPPYQTNVAIFDVPDGWQDQSITAFRIAAAPGGTEASFVVTRDDSKGVTPFQEYVERQVDLCRSGLPGFNLLKSDFLKAQQRETAWLEFTWIKEPETLFLRQIMFDCGLFTTICTLTTTQRSMPFYEDAWSKLMASLTFREAKPVAFPQDPALLPQ